MIKSNFFMKATARSRGGESEPGPCGDAKSRQPERAEDGRNRSVSRIGSPWRNGLKKESDEMKKGNVTILASILATMLVAMAVGAGTMAYFSDTETSTGNIFTAGTLDLKLDLGGTWYDGDNMLVFEETDVKPGDSGEATISLHVIGNDAWLWITFEVTEDENGMNEPEALVDYTVGGDLAANMNVFI